MQQRWENKLGQQFFEDIGVQSGDRVLDFGCGEGRFSIPAARATGPNGQVFALDKDESSINTVRQKMSELSVDNITTIKTNGELATEFNSLHFDYILLYDILHYFLESQRLKLYKDLQRILKKTGILSVYPKHTASDFPLDNLKDITTSELVNEIEKFNLNLDQKIDTEILHSSHIERGIVYNFSKTNSEGEL